MKNSSLPPAQYIDTKDRLLRLAEQLAEESLIAIDTESNSLYAYRERVCLIQISTRANDYIVDPLAIKNIQPIGDLLANPNIEKVFHAAEYDLVCLKRDYGFEMVNLFDTMVAARIIGLEQVGLGNLLNDFLGVKSDKRHQRDNWGKRPLLQSSLIYAQKDTHYLPQLRDILQTQLIEYQRLEEASEIFAEICDVGDSEPRTFDPDGFWRLGIPNNLNRRQLAILRELYLMRESIAEKRDVPTFKVLSNRVLIALAEAEPRRIDELRHIHGLSPSLIRRYDRRIIQAVEAGRDRRLPDPPTPDLPPDPEVAERYTILQNWRKERAIARGVGADVIMSRQALWALAQKVPTDVEQLQTISGIGPWRLRTYGEELLDILTRSNGNGRNF